MRLLTIWDKISHDCLSEREAYGNLSSLMFVCIPSIELLEFIIDVRWHHQIYQFESWPIGSLETLDGEVESFIALSIILSSCNCSLIFFSFILQGKVILQHSLHLIHLLHATRNFQTCNK